MFEDVPKEEDIEYQFIKQDYYKLLKEINKDDKVYKEKYKIAKIADKMASDLCKMDYYTVGLCGFFAGVKGLLTNPDFIYACVSNDCRQARKDFKQKLYQEMFNNGDIMMIVARHMIKSQKKEPLQDISMLNSFYALCVNTVQMMYKYYTNGNFQLDDDKLETSYHQLCSNKRSMMDAIHKNIRAIVYLAKGGSLPTNSHPNDISRRASYFLNNVLPQGQQFLSISNTPEGHKTNAANRQLDLDTIGVHAYASIEMFNCLAKDAYTMNNLIGLFSHQEIPFMQNWLQKRKETVKKNLNLQHDIATYTTAQLLQTIQQKAKYTAQQQNEQLMCQSALNQIALCLRNNFNIFPWNSALQCGQTYRKLGLQQQLLCFCASPTIQNYIYLLFAANGTPIYCNQGMNEADIMQTFANIKNVNAQFIQHINLTYNTKIDDNFSNHLIANFLSAPFEQQYRDTLCKQLDINRRGHDEYIKNILNWSKDQQSKIQMKTQYILKNYPGLKAIVCSLGHYYNTYDDRYECGNNNAPSSEYNSLKNWGKTQYDKQLSFDIITATPKDIDRQTDDQQLPNLEDFVRHDKKDKTGNTDCVLNLMGFNGDGICQNHCGIQNIHTLSSTYNHSNGDSSQPPITTDIIFDSMLHDANDNANGYRPEQQIQTAGDIWLNDLDKPLWAKSIKAEPTTRSRLCTGTTLQNEKDICDCLQQLIQSWHTAVDNPNDQNIKTLRIEYNKAWQKIKQINVYSEVVKTNTNLAEHMNTTANLHFKKPCWQEPCDNNELLLHIKKVVIPILCAVSGQQKYDVFFGCYNDWSMFKQLIEQKFNKPLIPKNPQNNQPTNTNKQDNNINNINNNTNIINNNNEINNINNNIIIKNDIYNHRSRHDMPIANNQDNNNNEKKPQSDNTFQCPQCTPQCCVNLCAKICPNYIQQSQSRDD